MSKFWLTASDFASLVVCPESFRLKKTEEIKHSTIDSESKSISREARQHWSKQHSMLVNFKRYRRAVFGMLFVLLGLSALGELVFDQQELRWAITSGRHESSMLAGIPVDLFALLVVLGVGTMLWDLFERKSKAITREIGLDPLLVPISSNKMGIKEGRELSSQKLMLKSRPHAFIEEGKLLLPLDIHPSTDKIRDRHVVQLLVHLKILSEKLAAALPHGYLLMGPKSRLVKIAFDEEKQSWIESMYKQAGAILDSNSAEALPEKYKCRGCDVREFCQFRADRIGS